MITHEFFSNSIHTAFEEILILQPVQQVYSSIQYSEINLKKVNIVFQYQYFTKIKNLFFNDIEIDL